jgi:hypothetical protein
MHRLIKTAILLIFVSLSLSQLGITPVEAQDSPVFTTDRLVIFEIFTRST